MDNRQVIESLITLGDDVLAELADLGIAAKRLEMKSGRVSPDSLNLYLEKYGTFAKASIVGVLVSIAEGVDLGNPMERAKMLSRSPEKVDEWLQMNLPFFAILTVIGIDSFDHKDFELFYTQAQPMISELIEQIATVKAEVMRMRKEACNDE